MRKLVLISKFHCTVATGSDEIPLNLSILHGLLSPIQNDPVHLRGKIEFHGGHFNTTSTEELTDSMAVIWDIWHEWICIVDGEQTLKCVAETDPFLKSYCKTNLHVTNCLYYCNRSTTCKRIWSTQIAKELFNKCRWYRVNYSN